MIEKISEEEISFVECLYNPIFLVEALFPKLDVLHDYDPDTFSFLRHYQMPFLSYEYLYDLDALDPKERMAVKKGAGDVYCFGARKYGKSLCSLKLDLLINFFLSKDEWIGLSSYDASHIESVIEPVIQALERHSILNIYKTRAKRAPHYRIEYRNNALDGINMNLKAKSPGEGFFGKHLTRLFIEENSMETDEVYKKRLDAVSEVGCVYRLSGMVNFTKHSPCGRIYYDLSKKTQIVNLPQFVNPMWDEKMKKIAVKEHGGESSTSFKVFVNGEVVESEKSVLDMNRIRKNYDYDVMIKHIEVDKEGFASYQNTIIVERPKNADVIYLASDVGEIVTELIIISEFRKTKEDEAIYKYLYNITLYNLTHIELIEIFKYVAELIEANFVALDTTDQLGRAIYRELSILYGKERMGWASFNEKIAVGVETDENGNDKFKGGQLVYKEEYVDAWSIKRLRDLLYEEGKFSLPCFKEGTEILTDNGWKDFKKIQYSDKIASLDYKSNRVLYNEPKEIIKNYFDGELISYKSSGLDFSVTPDHSFLIKSRRGKLKFKKVTDLKTGENIIRSFGNYQSKKPEVFIIPSLFYKGNGVVKREEISFNIKDWLGFIGWYVSEGCLVKNNGIQISQIGKHRIEIEKILRRLDIHYQKFERGFSFNNKQIYLWLKENCYLINENSRIKNGKKSLYNCYSKKIPNFIKNLHPNLLKVFLDEYIKGDGHIYKTKFKNTYAYTSSKQLADDLQEIILKIGKNAIIKKIPPQTSVFKDGRVCKSSGGYCIRIKNKDKYVTQFKKKNLSKEIYNGFVYDITIEPFHTIFVRYNGKSFWSGNCDFKFDTQFNAVQAVRLGNRTVYRCFREGTEILTKKGWKDFRDISYKDSFATLNLNNRSVEYKKAKRIYNYDYDGNLINHDGIALKFSVTPNHSFLVERPHNWHRKKNKMEFIDIEKIVNTSRVLRSLGKCKGKKIKYFEFKKWIFNKRKSYKRVEMVDWLEFLGWFVSEGSTWKNKKGSYSISIAQEGLQGRREIENVINKLGFGYCETKEGFLISSKWLFNWLSKNCYTSEKRSSFTKKTPQFIRNLDNSLIRIYLDSFIKGDGWLNKEKVWDGLLTSSYTLANDLQELFSRVDRPATIYVVKGSGFNPDGTYYTVHLGKETKSKYSSIKFKNFKSERYKGKVYDIEIEPYHTIYIKYKGKSFWCGNCSQREDHLLAAFRVFFVAQWQNEFVNVPRILKKSFYKSGC